MSLAPTVHATAVAIGDRAVLITGPPGSGKSDLALRLIDRGAVLVADDRVVLTRDGDRVVAGPPSALAGLIEVRGVGVIAADHRAGVAVALVVDLARSPERLPEPASVVLAGVAVACAALAGFESSAAVKVERLLDVVARGDRR